MRFAHVTQYKTRHARSGGHEDERIEIGNQGCKLSNYMLAHEFAHSMLNHHAQGVVVKNFKLFFAQFSNRGHSPYFRYNLSLICPRLYRKFGTYLRFKN